MRENRVRHQPATTGHETPSTAAYLTELKLPAVPDYIVVAKRAAASLGLVVGFSVQEIDDLNIAVTQACESACAAATQQWGKGNGQLKLTFKSRPRRLEVEVRSVPPRAVEQQTVRRARHEAELDYETIGLNMIRLFVDELRYQVDNQTGSLRMRMVKYLIE
ncbi:MAG: ATP-binding protein [Candidatus Dormibacteraeota bacterium]|nr:ATP-binding protein [Candidatus Dormibacteraeota bacterium]